MKKAFALIMSCVIGVSLVTGCGSVKKDKSEDITIVWYPNESGGEYEDARNEIGTIIEKATGKKVEHKLTTDYLVAIESISNGTGGIAFMGAEGYIEAHKKNEKVEPLMVASGKSGTLDDALYHSWIAVNKDNASEYMKDGKYTIDNIQGKKMSFVSNSSTSGFKVPTSNILNKFSSEDKWKDLNRDQLSEGGSDKFFSEVLFGGSHQGSAVNLLTGKADVAAFCDTNLNPYAEVESGEANTAGAVYKIKANASEPFNTLGGKEYTLISSTPVLNAPFVINTEVISADDKKKILDAFTSDEVANNKKIFSEKGSDVKGFFEKTGKEKFLPVEDSWFDPIRNL